MTLAGTPTGRLAIGANESPRSCADGGPPSDPHSALASEDHSTKTYIGIVLYYDVGSTVSLPGKGK